MPAPPITAARVPARPGRPVHRALAHLRRVWRQRVRSQWQALRGPVFVFIGIGSLILGTIGFLQISSVIPRYNFFDAFYRALTLFGFGGAATPRAPWTLQVARITAPIVTGYAAVGTVLALTRAQARVLGIRLFVRNHVIIAGLGETGARLADALVEQVPVVTIETDLANPHLAGARLRGVRTLTGNAADPDVLEQAGLHNARTLVVVCGAGGTNIDVAAAATRCVDERRHPLTLFVQLTNLDLWSSLAVEGATFEAEKSNVRLEYFNVLATGAQLLLGQDPPFAHHEDTPPADRRPEHILIVGLEGVGEQLVLQLARRWGLATPVAGPEHPRLRLTVTGAGAEEGVAALRERTPSLDAYCDLGVRALSVSSAAFQAGDAMVGPDGTCDVTRAYVSLIDEGQALLAALALHARPDTAEVPVTVAVSDNEAGVSVILGSDRGRFGQIKSFGVLTEATNGDLLLRGTNELLARAQHAQWLERQRKLGVDPDENEYLKPWEDLTETQRETNRRFADDLHGKLELVNCMLVPNPLPGPGAKPFTFEPDELELLAQHEHVRWMKEKLDAGWTAGQPRDDAKKVHDQIKPWEQLDEPNREKDRDAVREVPRMLARAGFAIRRRD